jgi:hypothetical protein
MAEASETFGAWGCHSCRRTVRNNHTGQCIECGGQIGRIVRGGGLEREVVRVTAPLPRMVEQPAPRSTRNLLAIFAAACLCIGSPWNVAAAIWGLSLSCYGCARVRARAYPLPG